MMLTGTENYNQDTEVFRYIYVFNHNIFHLVVESGNHQF